MAKTGVLLLNIGSPESFAVQDVKRYLKTFLMDPDIVNIPFFVRWFLVHGIIVPRRAKYSAKNYEKIWMKNEGSPLTVFSAKFSDKLQKHLGDKYIVKIGMRYSEPSIETALKDIVAAKIDSLILAPLYPQYAEATTGSSLKEVNRIMAHLGMKIPIKTVLPFFGKEVFIQNYVEVVQEKLMSSAKPDHFLFSFHGLPESHIRKINGCLSSEGCCFLPSACEKGCYRAQCYATATNIAESLNIPDSHWSVSFQSRLGRGEWLKPSTDNTLEILAKKGKNNVAIICPSFVTDCLETLEEIGVEGQALFKNNGGKEFTLVPCLNDRSSWINGFSHLIKELETAAAESKWPS